MVRKDRGPGRRVGRPLLFGGHPLEAPDIARIQALLARRQGSNRLELATLVSKEFGWRRANGDLRWRATLDLLERLDSRGLIVLPPSMCRRDGLTAQDQPKKPLTSFFSSLPAKIGPGDVSLRRVVVRPISQHEQPAWREAMERFHYLHSARLIGESIRYVAESDNRWLALLGWGVAAWKNRHREAFVGWNTQTMYQRLHFVANNARFLILPWVSVPHLASRVLSQNLRRLSADWKACYGHPIFLAETFVDLAYFHGTSYRAANWIFLGETRGMARKGEGYVAHGRKKALFVYLLHRRTRELLSAPFPPPEILGRAPMSKPKIDVNKLPIEGQGSLMEALLEISDPRRPRGIRHPFRSVLALAIMGTLSGMRSYLAIAEWAADAPKSILKALRFPGGKAPSEPTFRRVLQSVDTDEVDRVLGDWISQHVRLEAVAIDGKTLKGSKDGDRPALHLLSAVTHKTKVVIAQKQIANKSNEITAAKPLLQDLDLEGRIVTADAMHTQKELAKFLVEQKKAHYVFIAKNNQPTLVGDIQDLSWDSFFPSGGNFQQGPRQDRMAPDPSER